MEKLVGYIDFDGVILDTENGLFDQYHTLKEKGIVITKEQYLAEMDWNSWLANAAIINNSIGILKAYPSTCFSILTTIHSFYEGKAKVDYLRNHGVKNDIIVVPHICRKHEIVNPQGRFLVDDYSGNLTGWQDKGGLAIRFSTNTQKVYTDFRVVSSLEEVLKDI